MLPIFGRIHLWSHPLAESDHPFDRLQKDLSDPNKQVVGIGPLTADPETTAKLRAVYLGLAAEVDHHIGRLLNDLDERGQLDQTLTVVTADHGEMLGDNGLWGKMTHQDAGFHVPLIIRHPRYSTSSGTVVDAPTESIDVAPTILDLVAGDWPDAMDGQSLRPFLAGEAPQ